MLPQVVTTTMYLHKPPSESTTNRSPVIDVALAWCSALFIANYGESFEDVLFYLLQKCLKIIYHFICGGYLLWFIYLCHQLTSFLNPPSTVPDQQGLLVPFNLLCVMEIKINPTVKPYSCFFMPIFLKVPFFFVVSFFNQNFIK